MKRINGSVGNNAKNAAKDVMTVQYLLNCVPKFKGGPDQELAVDGMCGPKTCGAISKFQKQQTGFADGRVDPNGKTMAALNNFDPYPAHDPFAGMSGGAGGGKQGYGGTQGVAGKQTSGKQSPFNDQPGAPGTKTAPGKQTGGEFPNLPGGGSGKQGGGGFIW